MKYLKKFENDIPTFYTDRYKKSAEYLEIYNTLKDILLELEDEGFDVVFIYEDDIDMQDYFEINICKEKHHDDYNPDSRDTFDRKYLEKFSYIEIADVVYRMREYMRSISGSYWKFSMNSWEPNASNIRLTDDKIKNLEDKNIKKDGFTIEFNLYKKNLFDKRNGQR